MPTRASKRQPKPDLVSTAFRIVQEAKGQAPKTPPDSMKNPAAVALGRLGASKGGKARAASLSAAERKAIAKRAAAARWGKPGKKGKVA